MRWRIRDVGCGLEAGKEMDCEILKGAILSTTASTFDETEVCEYVFAFQAEMERSCKIAEDTNGLKATWGDSPDHGELIQRERGLSTHT